MPAAIDDNASAAEAPDGTVCACGYDLGGLALSSVCPECGLGVARTLRPPGLESADARWVTGIASGLRLASLGLWAWTGTLLTSPVLQMVYFATAPLSVSPQRFAAWLIGLTLAVPALSLMVFLAGSWRCCAPEPGVMEPVAARPGARRISRWSLAIVAGLGLGGAAAAGAVRAVAGEWPLVAVDAGLILLTVSIAFTGLPLSRVIRSLLDRTAGRRIGLAITQSYWLIGIAMGVTVCLAFIVTSPGRSMAAMFGLPWLVLLVLFGRLAWLLGRAARVVRGAARLAQSRAGVPVR